MSSYRTGRRLSAAVISTLLMATLAACGGGGGGRSSGGGVSTTPPSSGNPNPNPPTTTPDSTPERELSRLTLTGTVTDAPIANAVVTATIGDETFTANADANGVYSLPIAIDPDLASGFVTLSARGVGSQSYVEFTSLAGTFSALQAQAGDDDTLSNTENFATQITNVSTAQAVLIKEASGGSPITSDAILRTLSATLNSQEVLDLATAIKLFVDDSGNYPMPAGQTSLLALMSNTATREQFVDGAYDQNPTAFSSTQTAIVTDTTLTQPISSVSLPEKLTVAMLSNAEFAFNFANRINSYTFNTNGTGTATAGAWESADNAPPLNGSSVATTWTINGGSIEITYGQPVMVKSYETCANVPEQVEAKFISDGVTLTLLSDRVLAITETNHITYPTSCNLAPRTETKTVARTILNDEDFEQIEAADLADTIQSIYVYQDGVGVRADVAELNADGTGLTWAFEKTFTWALDDTGRIVTATFPDGTVAKFRSLREVDDVMTDLYYEIVTPGGQYVDAGASVYADPEQPLAFTPNNMVGRFYQFGIGDEITRDSRQKGFRLLFNNDGTGAQELDLIDANNELVTKDGASNAIYNFRWDIDDGDEDVIIQRTFDLGGGGYNNCAFGSSVDCVLWDERRLVPLASVTRTGERRRAYWMEYRRTADPGFVVDNNTIPTTLVRYYDYEPLSAPVVVNGKPSLVNKGSARKLRFHGVAQR